MDSSTGHQASDFDKPAERPTLASLAALGAEELAARLARAMPGVGDNGGVGVAAFNSSI